MFELGVEKKKITFPGFSLLFFIQMNPVPTLFSKQIEQDRCT